MVTQTTFFFNGDEFYSKDSITLEDLLNYFAYNSSIFVVEYNKFICNQNKWKDIEIQSNDKIEIITIVGGG
uniref:Thiamine biosynthesis protein n=1 Tax=Chaetoceros costatus TaxID=426630 RepID=A0A8F5PLC8_9STRA|nr:Thiamine biosynthesis protein [Chaetoceros costatus]